MKKAQELSLNMIVVGALALLVLILVAGILIFGGGNLFSGLTNIGPSNENVKLTSFISHCQSKCNTLNMLVNYDDIKGGSISQTDLNYIKSYCCESSDLDESGNIDAQGDLGPEICSLAYDCKLDGHGTQDFCKNIFNGAHDFTNPGTSGDTLTCGLN